MKPTQILITVVIKCVAIGRTESNQTDAIQTAEIPVAFGQLERSIYLSTLLYSAPFLQGHVKSWMADKGFLTVDEVVIVFWILIPH